MSASARSGALDRALLVTLGVLSGGMLLAMAGFTVLDVLGRAALNRPIPAAYELVQVFQAVLVFSALPLATRGREHITMGVNLGALGPRFGAAVAVLVDLASIAFLAVLAWRLLVLGNYLADMGERLMFLRWPVAPVAWFAAAMTALSAAILLAVAVSDLRRGGARRAAEFLP